MAGAAVNHFAVPLGKNQAAIKNFSFIFQTDIDCHFDRGIASPNTGMIPEEPGLQYRDFQDMQTVNTGRNTLSFILQTGLTLLIIPGFNAAIPQ